MHTTEKNRHRRVIGAIVGAMLIATGILGAVVVGQAQADDPPPVEASAGEVSAGVGPLDPVTEALGADTPEEIAALQDAQQELNAVGATDGPEGQHVNEVRSDLGDAVDELYEDVADDPQAARARTWWRDCMVVRGTPFDSPTAIEEAIDAPRDDLNQLDGHDLPVVLANRDACEAEAATLLAALLEGRFPEWAQEHATTIDEYRALIDAVSG